ncbi:MAG: ABC transporter permease [Thermoplasmatota archaeon]
MKKIISVFTALFKNWFRSKTGVFFSLLFPMMLLIIFSTVFGGQGSAEYDLYVQNNDVIGGETTNVSESFIDALEATETFNIKRLDRDVNVTKYQHEKSFGAYRALVIPEEFQKKALNKSMSIRAGVMYDTLTRIEEMGGDQINEGERENLTKGISSVERWKNQTKDIESAELLLLTSEGDQAAPIVKGVTYSVVDTFNSQLIGVKDTTVDVKSESIEKRDLGAADYYLPGYIAAFVMTNGIIGVTSNVSEFKRNGTLKRLAATPLKKRDWIISNILQQAVLAFILTAVMILLGVALFGVQVYPGPLAMILILLGSLAFSSVGMVMGGIIKDVEAASGAGNAIAFPMMFLSGAFWPIENMPEYLQTVAKVLPLYYFHQGLRSIMILDNPSESGLAFAVIGGFALIFIIIAIKTTSWKEL